MQSIARIIHQKYIIKIDDNYDQIYRISVVNV